MTEEIEKIIRAFFDEAAWVKLERQPDGSLWDRDSNWGFDPAELARLIGEKVASELGSALPK